MSKKPLAVVTGGAGFIGSHMVDLLADKGFRVNIVDNLVGGNLLNVSHHADNPDVHLEEIDIRSISPSSNLFEEGCYVFHFAGLGDIVPSIEAPAEYLDVNVRGTVQVLEAARINGASKFVYAASSSCYGLADTPTTEDHPIQPMYPYALSKNLGEQTSMHWHKVYGLPVNSVRIFNAYGTRSRTSGAYGAVFGVFLKQIMANKPLTVVGDGTQTRDFIYVTDLARAFWAAADTDKSGQVWNAGFGNPKSVNELVNLLGGERVEIPKRPGEPEVTWADISKIRQELGWEPEVSFEDGVKLILENIDYWRDAPLWTPESIQKETSSWFKYLGEDQSNSGS